MYSLNFNEEDKNKKSRHGGSEYFEENGYSTAPGNETVAGEDAVADENMFYGSNGLLGKTTYVSPFMDDAGKRPISSMKWGVAGTVKPATEKASSLQVANVTTENGVPEYMTGRQIPARRT